MKLRKMTVGQQLGWALASVIYGAGILFVAYAHRDEFLGNPDNAFLTADPVVWFALGIAWLVGVIGMRFYLQDKGPTNILSLLGIKQ